MLQEIFCGVVSERFLLAMKVYPGGASGEASARGRGARRGRFRDYRYLVSSCYCPISCCHFLYLCWFGSAVEQELRKEYFLAVCNVINVSFVLPWCGVEFGHKATYLISY